MVVLVVWAVVRRRMGYKVPSMVFVSGIPICVLEWVVCTCPKLLRFERSWFHCNDDVSSDNNVTVGATYSISTTALAGLNVISPNVPSSSRDHQSVQRRYDTILPLRSIPAQFSPATALRI